MKILKSVKKEITNHPFIYALLFIAVFIGFIFRVYRLPENLGFYYDQGRDALVIWDFIHKGKLFLVGPTTGIAGIFRGPFYYYLIAPWYFLGKGDPLYPSIFLILTSTVAIFLTYYLGVKIQNRTTGLIAAILASFSFDMVIAARWLSNPTPMLLLSMILLWMMILVTEGKKWAWPVIAFTAGLSLFHFGSAGEFFYFPALFVFALWQRKKLPSKKVLLLSFFLLLFTALPQIIFDIRHDGILRQNITKFFTEDKSFKGITSEIITTRTKFYYDVFTRNIFYWRSTREIILLIVASLVFILSLPRFMKNKSIKTIILLLLAPIIGLYFFQGNYGNIYGYYLTGYFLIFILFVAVILGVLWRLKIGKIIVLYFLYVFFVGNIEVILYKITDRSVSDETIILGNQKQALEWIYNDASNEAFNVDVYVPPVIPYAYDYLFLWYVPDHQSAKRIEEKVPLLYTLMEVDPSHPDRIGAWLERQDGIATVEKEMRFNGIIVQRRKRI